jgi:thiamine-phosphate pyrophosphorylase
MTARRLPPLLLALSPGDLAPRACAEFARRAAAARRAGLSGLLLREPGLPERDWLALALELAALFHAEADGWLAIHDRAHLAVACAADALHLGHRSLPPALVRGWLDAEIAIGLSTHAHDDPAAWVGADYLFHGPVLATPSKQGLLEPLGFEGLARGVRAAGATAVWGIGGLGPEHLAPALAAGAQGVAARAAVFGGDPTRRMVPWLAALEAVRRGGAA